MIMSETSRGSEPYHLPSKTTSYSAAGTLDNFLMEFDPQSSLASDDVNGINNEATEEIEDYTAVSSSTLHDYDNIEFSSQMGYEFPMKATGLNEGIAGSSQSEVTNERILEASPMPVVSTPTLTSISNISVPEFLYQLTKMLTENNSDVIEWSHGRIEVHSPQKLESDVLKKYFRHSKFASFQRQLNYFGFRKIAGKGKMAPCSYVNDAAMEDISSLFQIKRKSGPDPQEGTNAKKKRDKPAKLTGATVNPVLAGIFKRTTKQYISEHNPLSEPISLGDAHSSNRKATSLSTTMDIDAPTTTSASVGVTADTIDAHHELARRAIGRGIRHGLGGSTAPNLLPPVPMPLLPSVPMPLIPSSTSASNSLSELANNYQNSLKQDIVTEDDSDNNPTPLSRMQSRISSEFDNGMLECSEFLSRNSSLIDLAMLAPIDDALNCTNPGDENGNNSGECFEFLDFPNS